MLSISPQKANCHGGNVRIQSIEAFENRRSKINTLIKQQNKTKQKQTNGANCFVFTFLG